MLYNYVKILKYICFIFKVKEDYEKIQRLDEQYKKEVNNKEKQVFFKNQLSVFFIFANSWDT